MTRRRRLSQAEQALWQKVARSAERLHPEQRASGFPPERRPASSGAASGLAPRTVPLAPFQIGDADKSRPGSWSVGSDAADPLAETPLRMDDKAYRKLRRGKLKPQARLDLHGMTLAEARPALIAFILNAQGQGLRMVLVITGKGRDRGEAGPIPVRPGALRRSVPLWLRMPPLAPAVLQVAPAHLRHGGDGALYVHLKRRR